MIKVHECRHDNDTYYEPIRPDSWRMVCRCCGLAGSGVSPESAARSFEDNSLKIKTEAIWAKLKRGEVLKDFEKRILAQSPYGTRGSECRCG